MNTPHHILITGGAGTIGALLCRQALAAGHRITVVDDLDPVQDTSARTHVLTDLRSRPLATVVQGDVRDAHVLGQAFAAPITAVVHLAGRPHADLCARDPLACHGIHVQGTLAVLEQVRAHRIPHLVLGGIPATAEPADVLAASMLAAERFARVHAALHGLRITLVRMPELREGDAERAAEHLLAQATSTGHQGFTEQVWAAAEHPVP